MLEEVMTALKSLPPDILQAFFALVKLLLNTKDEATRRAAVDAALAAGEAEIVRREFPSS